MDTLEIYPDESGKWRWRARAANGAITASSGEGFDSHANATRAALRFVDTPKEVAEDESQD